MTDTEEVTMEARLNMFANSIAVAESLWPSSRVSHGIQKLDVCPSTVTASTLLTDPAVPE